MTNAALRGKPDAGNPHVRFDEGEVAPAATPRRGSLLYNDAQLKRIKEVVANNPGIDLHGIERKLECFIIDRMSQEQFEAECQSILEKDGSGGYVVK